ncbi:MAG: hypothetical protein L0Y71_17060 [Gemmataceae bacterium]|nr:hypothetical protein [Gemmataceae bacterium]
MKVKIGNDCQDSRPEQVFPLRADDQDDDRKSPKLAATVPLTVNVYGAAFGRDPKVRAQASPVNHVREGASCCDRRKSQLSVSIRGRNVHPHTINPGSNGSAGRMTRHRCSTRIRACAGSFFQPYFVANSAGDSRSSLPSAVRVM